MCAPCVDHMTIFIIFFDSIFEMIFNAAQSPGRKKLAIGQCIDAIFVAADANKFLDITVPWRQVVVTDRPIDGEAISRRPFEVVVAPALCLPGPQDAFTTYLIT